MGMCQVGISIKALVPFPNCNGRKKEKKSKEVVIKVIINQVGRASYTSLSGKVRSKKTISN